MIPLPKALWPSGAPCPLTRLRPGGNSRVWLARPESAPPFVVKQYYGLDGRGPARLAAEYQGLSFLWKCGERDIPRPLGCDPPSLTAAFAFLPGQPLGCHPDDPDAVEPFAAFAGRLRTLAGQPAAAALAPASDANLEEQALPRQLAARLARLANASRGDDGPARELAAFLREELVPFVAALTPDPARLAPSPAAVTLSPSDFGFHNALRRPDGRTVFVDFEYFGRDDPAKLTADFLLHPAMDLGPGQRQRFYAAMAAVFADQADFAARLETIFPLVAAKWCLIVLNEFAGTDRNRRSFAAAAQPGTGHDPRPAQLAKARAMLARARRGLTGALS